MKSFFRIVLILFVGGTCSRLARSAPSARALVAGSIESQYEDNGLYHRGFCCDLTDDRGERYELKGRVVRFIPFRHRPTGHITHIGQGMTEFTCRSRVAYGLSEYMDLVR